jgi:SAM-dependent methyltransferase
MNCPVCGGKSDFEFKSHLDKNIYQCSLAKCRHLFVEDYKKNSGIRERPVEDGESKKDKERRLRVFSKRNQEMFKALWRDLKLSDSARVLDFGAGDGHMMSGLKSVFPNAEVTSIEANKGCHKLLAQDSDVIVESMEDLIGKYDLIFLNEVIEHLNKPEEVLSELAKRLSGDNAAIYIATPLGETHLGTRKKHPYNTGSHLHFFTRRSLNLCLSNSGLTSLSMHDTNYPLYSSLINKNIKGIIAWMLANSFLQKLFYVLPVSHISGVCYKK